MNWNTYFPNALGKVSAGGVNAAMVRNLRIKDCTFMGCEGLKVGGIHVIESCPFGEAQCSNNLRHFSNLTLHDCHGDNSWSQRSGYAGGIAVTYGSTNGVLMNNTNIFENISVSNSSGSRYGGGVAAAGGIVVRYSVTKGIIQANLNTFTNIKVAHCQGGVRTTYGGGAGGLTVSYYAGGADGSYILHNKNLLSNVSVKSSFGGLYNQRGMASLPLLPALLL